jgi:hypothetical protein
MAHAADVTETGYACLGTLSGTVAGERNYLIIGQSGPETVQFYEPGSKIVLDIIECTAKGSYLEVRVAVDEARQDRSWAEVLDINIWVESGDLVTCSDSSDLSTVDGNSASGNGRVANRKHVIGR